MSTTIPHPKYGFRMLDPIPTREDLSRFYQSSYFDLLKKGDRAPELRRLMAGGAEGKRERDWLQETVYSDVLAAMKPHLPAGLVLDLGCGMGEFVAFLKEEGLQAVGVEPSSEGVALAQERGLNVSEGTIEEYAERHREQGLAPLAAITMMNVLEHVPNPVEIVQTCRDLLTPAGLLVIRVPNDFSPLQLALTEATGREPWWIAVPDHINYFTFASLARTLDDLGFDQLYAQADFPMEFFMMMGDDYIRDSQLGPQCHARRIAFEKALPTDLRRGLYQDFAARGIGRTALVVGRKRD